MVLGRAVICNIRSWLLYNWEYFVDFADYTRLVTRLVGISFIDDFWEDENCSKLWNDVRLGQCLISTRLSVLFLGYKFFYVFKLTIVSRSKIV